MAVGSTPEGQSYVVYARGTDIPVFIIQQHADFATVSTRNRQIGIAVSIEIGRYDINGFPPVGIG